MRKRGRKRKRQKQLLSHCLSFSGAFYVHVVVVRRGGHEKKPVARSVKSFIRKAVCKMK